MNLFHIACRELISKPRSNLIGLALACTSVNNHISSHDIRMSRYLPNYRKSRLAVCFIVNPLRLTKVVLSNRPKVTGHEEVMDGDPTVEPQLDTFSLILPLPYRIAVILVLGERNY